MSMEQQLAAYRAKKAKEKEETDGNAKSNVGKVFNLKFLTRSRNRNSSEEKEYTEAESLLDDHEEHFQSNKQPETTASSTTHQHQTFLGRLFYDENHSFRTTTLLKCLLWLILWGLFIELEFGSVYFILSLFYFVYSSMRTGSRDRSQLSAYSVFNPNFERLEGTFTAEQFEKELKFGAASVH